MVVQGHDGDDIGNGGFLHLLHQLQQTFRAHKGIHTVQHKKLGIILGPVVIGPHPLDDFLRHSAQGQIFTQVHHGNIPGFPHLDTEWVVLRPRLNGPAFAAVGGKAVKVLPGDNSLARLACWEGVAQAAIFLGLLSHEQLGISGAFQVAGYDLTADDHQIGIGVFHRPFKFRFPSGQVVADHIVILVQHRRALLRGAVIHDFAHGRAQGDQPFHALPGSVLQAPAVDQQDIPAAVGEKRRFRFHRPGTNRRKQQRQQHQAEGDPSVKHHTAFHFRPSFSAQWHWPRCPLDTQKYQTEPPPAAPGSKSDGNRRSFPGVQ